MLVYKAAQVIACTRLEPKTWSMNGQNGTTHSAKMAVLGVDGTAENITLKAKTAEELNAKVAKYTLGKPGDVPIREVVPVFRSGDRKPSSYEFVG